MSARYDVGDYRLNDDKADALYRDQVYLDEPDTDDHLIRMHATIKRLNAEATQ